MTEHSSSNITYDTAGDGYQHRTAWAGAGDGVLAIDADGDGQITERKEIVFTDWDPAAKDDMAALRSVFDTNNNGKLDSGDDEFDKFRVVVTNADGTTTVKTLAQAGVASINLITDSTEYTLADGSAINGMTTYDKVGGGTGKAAAVTFAAEAQGYAIGNSTVVNLDGSTTITNTARNADGGIASVIVTNTSADGKNRTITFDDDGDGVVDKEQTIEKVSDGSGGWIETITNRSGGGVLLDRTKTETSADGSSIWIWRDTRGGDYFNETETRETVSGALTITLSQLTPDGSLITEKVTTTTSDGLSRTESFDFDSDTTPDLVVTETTIVNVGGSRTETVTTESGKGTLLSKTVTDIDAAGEGRMIVTDADGDGDTDLTTIVTVANVSGTTVTTQTLQNADKSMRGETITRISADSLTYVTEMDLDGDGNVDLTRSDVTVIISGIRTQTITETSEDGTTLSKTVIIKGANGRDRDIQIDLDGDKNADRTEVIAVAVDGSSVDTVTNLSANKTVLGGSVTKTSADGLTVTVELDMDGNGLYETKTQSATVISGGVSTVTETVWNKDTSLRGESVTTTSADGLSITTKFDRDGNGSFDWTTSDVTELKGDGSYVRTVTDKSENATTLAQSVTTVSADRDVISITRDLNGDGSIDQTEAIVRQENGDLVDTIVDKATNGATIGMSVTTTSANGLTSTTELDRNGDGIFDRTVTRETSIEDDGDRVTETIDKAGTTQIGKVTQTVSGNGLSIVTKLDLNGDDTTDLTTNDVTVLNADGSQTRTLSDNNGNDALRSQVVTTISDDGLTLGTKYDLDGDGTFDLTTDDVTVLNDDGSTTRTITNTNAHGIRDESETTTSADGRTITRTSEANGSVNTKQGYTRAIEADGDIVETVSNLDSADVLLNRTRTTTSGNGLVVTRETDQNGDGSYDVTTNATTALNADGSKTTTVTTSNGAGLIRRTETIVSDDGLTTTVREDADGDTTFDVTTISVRTLGLDGTVTDTVTTTNANGSQRSQTVTLTSADRKTVTITRALSGVIVQNETQAIQSNGDSVTFVTSRDKAGAILSIVTTTVSADGLRQTVLTKDGAGTIIDSQSTVKVLKADGGWKETLVQDGSVDGTIVTTTSANGLSKTQTATLSGVMGAATFKTYDNTVLNPDGSQVQTVSVKTGAEALKNKAVITTSDDGLSQSMTLDVDGNNTVDTTLSAVTGTDGSKVETATYNKLNGGLRRKDTISTSVDGRTVELERDTDGNNVVDVTITSVKNADGSVTETRVGTALGGVPAYSRVSRTEIDLDGGLKVVTEHFDGAGVLVARTLSAVSPNGLEETVSFDLNGDGNYDKKSTTVIVLNADGSKTETERYVLNEGVLGSERLTITSADGSRTETRLDMDGNGVKEHASVTTVAMDGSIVHDFSTFDNLTGALVSQRSISIGLGGQEVAQSTYDVIVASLQQTRDSQTLGKMIALSGNVGGAGAGYEWVYKKQTNNVLDTTTIFVGGSGSNQWVRTVSGTQVAYATHLIDANNVETWSWNISNATLWGQTSSLPIIAASGSIQIDTATRDLYLERADNIYSAALSREMTADERAVLAQYISNGVLNESLLATNILASSEFANVYGALNNVEFVTRLYMNAFGHLPSAAMRDHYVAQLNGGTMTRAAVLTALGSAIESGQITRSDWQNGVISSTVSYAMAGPGLIVDLANAGSNAGAALGDDFALVTNVVGSDYADTISGDAKDNSLNGDAGDDILDGRDGADTLYGGAGNDKLTGGAGNDTVRYDFEAAGVNVNLTTGSATGASSGTDTLSGIEHVVGSAHNDTLTGDGGSNTLTGGAGADTLNGAGGTDTVSYVTATAGLSASLKTPGGNTGDAAGDTYASIENLTGSSYDDVLQGDDNKNIINGGAGNDLFIATLGGDRINGGDGIDEISYVNATKGVYINLNAAQSESYWSLDVVTNIENATGSAFFDYVYGGQGDNRLDGGIGNDYLLGYAGNDTYVVDNVLETVVEAANEGYDTIETSVSYTLSANVERMILTGAGNINGIGNALDNVLIGNGGANTLGGGAGNDTLDGGAGADNLVGGGGNDIYVVDHDGDAVTELTGEGTDIVQSSVSFTLGAYVEHLTLTGAGNVNGTGNTGNNNLTGNSGANTLTGGGGNDLLDGGAGSDTLVGGAGDDTYVVDSYDDVITESNAEGTDTVQSAVTYVLSDNLEHLLLTGVSAINGTGNAANNALTGNSATNTLSGGGGNDTLDGGGGADTLAGGTGNDTYIVNDAGDTVQENASEGTDLVQSSVSFTLSNNVENLTLTGTASINGYGNSLANVLNGNSGNNVLDGGAGSDTLIGGKGDDTYYIDSIGDVITENASEGTEHVVSLLSSYTLGVNLEHLVLGGTGNLAGTGNSTSNVIYGNSGSNVLYGLDGDDTLLGGAGADALDGGNGNDWANYATANSGVSASLKMPGGNTGDAAGDTYTNIENLQGSNFGDTLQGNDSKNYINGGAGNDLFIATLGGDRIDGGDGIDEISYVNATKGVYINLNAAQSESYWSLDVVTNIENATGSAFFDYVYGGQGDNRLDGGIGNDYLLGYAGNDTYVVDNVLETVVEAANEGYDTIETSVSYTLSANVERMILTGAGNINGIGNALANVIHGNSGANTLSGVAGNDILYGGLGADKLDGGADWDVATYQYATAGVTVSLTSGGSGGEAAGDTFVAIEELIGSGFNDVLEGDAGANNISSGGGVDTLKGLGGNDTYFAGALDTVVEAAAGGTDTIYVYDASGTVAYTLAAEVENLYLMGAMISGTGNVLNNALTGNALSNTLSGGGGNDTLDGGAGADTLAGGTGNDTYLVDNSSDTVTENASEGTDLVQSAVSFVLGANVENLTLTGTASVHATGNDSDNVLTGNSGSNWLVGGKGNDTMSGGTGDDVYVVDSAGDVVNEAASAGLDTVFSEITYTLGTNLENLQLSGTAAINGTGNTVANFILGNVAANTLNGGDGDDYLAGGGGADSLIGGNGNDWAHYEYAAAGVAASLAAAVTNTGEAAGDTYTSIENLLGSGFDDKLEGNASKNYINGGAGNDLFIATLGGDRIDGGDGIDEISYVNATKGVYINLNAAQSESYWSLDVVTNIENATGSAFFDYVYGGQGDNRLDGGIGNDYLLGYAGNDTYVVDNVLETVVEAANEGYDTIETSVSYTLSANVERMILTGAGNINGIGNALDNVLIGNGGANTLGGGAGNDTLDGGAGADNLVGGGGNDIYVVDHAGDAVTELTGEGTDIVQSSVSFTLGTYVEHLTLTGAGNVNGTGNASNNNLTGNSGANTLAGGGGNDLLIGGTGNDSLVGGAGADIYQVGRGDGADEIAAALDDGSADKLQFSGDVDSDQLWFSQSGDDLVVSLIGTTDSMTVRGWYAAGNDRLERIVSGDGDYLLADDVESLVIAMASMTPPPVGQVNLAVQQQQQLAGVLASSWHSAGS